MATLPQLPNCPSPASLGVPTAALTRRGGAASCCRWRVRAGSADRQTDTLPRRAGSGAGSSPGRNCLLSQSLGWGCVGGGGVSAVFRRCCCFNQLKDGFETVDVTMFGKVFTSASQPLRRHMEVGRGREDAAEEITHVRNFANTGS